MLGAEAFKFKVIKFEQANSKDQGDDKKKKKPKLAKGGSNAMASASMDSVSLKVDERANNISDPMLIGINEFVNDLKLDIMSAGSDKLNLISKLYKDFAKAEARRLAKEAEAAALREQEYENTAMGGGEETEMGGQDTVEQVLGDLEDKA